MDFEFAIRKEIPNRPIPHEVDRARQRDLWQWVGVVVPLAAILLVLVWQHFELVQHGYRLEKLQRALAAEEETRRQLRFEIEELQRPQRIEAYAIDRLHLVRPSAADAIILPRVTPSAPPPASVVAARR